DPFPIWANGNGFCPWPIRPGRGSTAAKEERKAGEAHDGPAVDRMSHGIHLLSQQWLLFDHVHRQEAGSCSHGRPTRRRACPAVPSVAWCAFTRRHVRRSCPVLLRGERFSLRLGAATPGSAGVPTPLANSD